MKVIEADHLEDFAHVVPQIIALESVVADFGPARIDQDQRSVWFHRGHFVWVRWTLPKCLPCKVKSLVNEQKHKYRRYRILWFIGFCDGFANSQPNALIWFWLIGFDYVSLVIPWKITESLSHGKSQNPISLVFTSACIPNLAEQRCRCNVWPCKGLWGSTLECWVIGCLACWAPLSARSPVQTRSDLWRCLDSVQGWILMRRDPSCTLATAASTDFSPCIREGNLILKEGPCLLMTRQTDHCVGQLGVISLDVWKVLKAFFCSGVRITQHSVVSGWLFYLLIEMLSCLEFRMGIDFKRVLFKNFIISFHIWPENMKMLFKSRNVGKCSEMSKQNTAM